MIIHDGSRARRERARFDAERQVRRWPRIVPTQQPLGPNEQLFVALHRFTATNVTRVIALEGGPSPRELNQALRVLQARHPLLRARIIDGKEPHFLHDSAPPLSLTVIPRRDDSHFREVLERLLNTPLSHDPGPLFEFHYVYSESKRCGELILVGDHAMCDGVSINNLCSELLELCARRVALPPRRRVEPLAKMLPASTPFAQATSFGRAAANFARVALSRALHEQRRPGRTSAYAYRALTSVETERLVATSRAQGTTVTGALMAAGLLAVREVRPAAPRLALSVPINLRPRIPEYNLSPRDLANLTGVAYLESSGRGALWPLARTMKAELDDATSSDALLSAVTLIYRAGKLMVNPARPPLAHAMISNSGVSPLRSDYGTFRPVGFYSATSAPIVSADLAFFCNTFDNQLCINLVFAREIVSREDAEHVLSVMYRHLTGV